MTDRASLAVLNQAFVRIYRSMGQYLREAAATTFDVGESEIRTIWEEEANDAQRLGRYLAEHQGRVYPGVYPSAFGDLHYLNASRLLPDWAAAQTRLIEDLQALHAHIPPDDPGGPILGEIIEHERDHLARLRAVRSAPVPA